MLSCLEVVLCFAKDPRIAHRCATDHDAAHRRALHAAFDVGAAGDVTIADHGDADRAGAFVDHVPVGFAAVALRACPAVDRDRLDPATLEDLADLDRVDRLFVPADADLRGDWDDVTDSLDDVLRDACQCGAIFEQRRAAVFGDHLVDWAAEVDVDEVRLFPVDDLLRRLRHADAVAAENLNADRSLAVVELGVFLRAVVLPDDALGRDELGDHYVGAEFFAERSKNHVGNTGHRGQVDREVSIFKPGEHARIELRAS